MAGFASPSIGGDRENRRDDARPRRSPRGRELGGHVAATGAVRARVLRSRTVRERSARSTRSSARDASTRAASSFAPVTSRGAVCSRFSRRMVRNPPARAPPSTRRARPLIRRAYGRAHGRHLRRAAARGQSRLCQEASLRSWVESKYTHVPLREKDTGTKARGPLYGAYF